MWTRVAPAQSDSDAESGSPTGYGMKGALQLAQAPASPRLQEPAALSNEGVDIYPAYKTRPQLQIREYKLHLHLPLVFFLLLQFSFQDKLSCQRDISEVSDSTR